MAIIIFLHSVFHLSRCRVSQGCPRFGLYLPIKPFCNDSHTYFMAVSFNVYGYSTLLGSSIGKQDLL